jgi:hypothetical protein
LLFGVLALCSEAGANATASAVLLVFSPTLEAGVKIDRERPPIYTVWEEFVGWTFDRTAAIPKSQRFTFGQRIDGMTLDILQMIVRCIYLREKTALLTEINFILEELRVLWRLVEKRGWISRAQLDFAQSKLDEAGRMIGGWLKQQTAKAASL